MLLKSVKSILMCCQIKLKSELFKLYLTINFDVNSVFYHAYFDIILMSKSKKYLAIEGLC
jgi:hypothetical protein